MNHAIIVITVLVFNINFVNDVFVPISMAHTFPSLFHFRHRYDIWSESEKYLTILLIKKFPKREGDICFLILEKKICTCFNHEPYLVNWL